MDIQKISIFQNPLIIHLLRKIIQYYLFLVLSVILLGRLTAASAETEKKKILLINSYHQGYSWTDSISSGVIRAVKELPDYTLFIESLNSKQFGQSKFGIEKEYFSQKYSGTSFCGVLVSDNDALDFAIQYKNELFPDVPVVYVGISNPEEYKLEGSMVYGIKETGDSKQVLSLIRQLLPESRRVFVIADKTTNGMLQRKEYTENARSINDFTVSFPPVVDLDSIYHAVQTGEKFDAIFYVGISQDKNGQLVNPLPVVEKISRLATVPVFTNDPQDTYTGILGGLFRFGEHHGKAAARLLVSLLNSEQPDTFRHINTTAQRFFFDKRMLDKYEIPAQRLPLSSSVFNKKSLFSRENFLVLLLILAFLSIALIILTVNIQNYRGKHKKSKNELKEIESQKNELEEAYEKLALTKATLEDTNMRLNDSNLKLAEAKKKAEESDQLKSAFLANVSHEIRTPLNSIVGFSSLLADNSVDDETRKCYIDLIESNSETLLVLIDEIIDLSKIEAGQLTIRKHEFSIDQLIGELFQIFIRENKNPDVEFLIDRISGTHELFANSDRVRVRQILINLLTNAFKFTETGSIEMGYKKTDGKVVLYVKDTGIGISEEHHQAIFHRFRKLNESQDKKIYRGTGLGLAITGKLVEMLGGRIWLESEPGKGSAFYFTLQDLELRDARAKKNQPELV